MTAKSATPTTAQIDEYLALADRLRFSDLAASLQHAENAATLSEQLGDVHRYGLALRHIAWCYSARGENERSLAYAMEGLKLSREFNLPDVEAYMVGAIGHCYFHAGLVNDALHLFEHAYNLGQQLEDPYIMVSALVDQAAPKSVMRDFMGAVGALQKALALMADDDSFYGALEYTATLVNLALMCDATTDYEQAFEYAVSALPHTQDLPKLASDAYLVMASYYRHQGDLEMTHEQIALSREQAASITPPTINYNTEILHYHLLQVEGDHTSALQVLEGMYTQAVADNHLSYVVRLLDMLKQAYTEAADQPGLMSVYKRMAEDMPMRQKQMYDLRMTLMQMIFDRSQSELKSDLLISQQINTLLTRMSHEFRTPLAIIRTTSDLINMYKDRLTVEQRQERLHKINDQVDWLTTMLDDMLQLVALDQKDHRLLEPLAFSLNELVADVLERITHYKGVTSERVQPMVTHGTAAVNGPYDALRTILVQLLTNAVKFSQDKVLLKITLEDRMLIAQVNDKGIGIPQADQQAIFQPMIRGSNLDEMTGTGLGLTLVQKLVQQMQGTLHIDSTEGAGTRVSLRVPLADAPLPG